MAGPLQAEQRALSPDANRYLVLADNLRRFQVFGKAREDGYVHQALQRLREEKGTLPPADEHGFRPEGFRTPGYPAFIAVTAAVFGDRRMTLVLQCLFGALMGLLVSDLARRSGLSGLAATATGFVWALHPGLAVYDGQYLTEGLFNTTIITGLWCVARLESVGQPLGALLVGVAGLVRPLGPLFLPTAIVLGFRQARARIAWILVAAALVAAPSLLWATRNLRVGEGFRVSTVGDFNLLFYTVPYSMAEAHGSDWNEEWRSNVDKIMITLDSELREGQDTFAAVRHLALQEIISRPRATTRVQIKAFVKLLVDHSLPDLYQEWGRTYEPSGLFSRLVLREQGGSQQARIDRTGAAAVVAWMMLNGLIVLSAGTGLALAVWRRRWTFVATWGLPVILFSIATGSVGLERFRMPVVLPLLMLCGYALDAAVGRAQDVVAGRRSAQLEVTSPQKTTALRN